MAIGDRIRFRRQQLGFSVRQLADKIGVSHATVSKWEAKWEIPFLKTTMSKEQYIDYIRCMTITQNVDPNIYKVIPNNLLKEINKYIDSKQTATWFNDNDKKTNRNRIVTSELIYYWMIACEIPFECQKWHLNRLITLIRVCQEESKPSKQMTAKERKALNDARKKKYHTKG